MGRISLLRQIHCRKFDFKYISACYLVTLFLRNIQMSLTANNSLIKSAQDF